MTRPRPRVAENMARLSPELEARARRLLRFNGLAVVARMLRTTPVTLEGLLGGGSKPATRDRIAEELTRLGGAS